MENRFPAEKQRFGITVRPDDQDFVYVGFNDVAAMLGVMDYYATTNDNPVPYRMGIVTTPSQMTVDFYKNIENNCLIQTPEDDKPRKLHLAEKEVLLWNLVKQFKYERTFKPEVGLKLRDYNWHVK